VAAARRLETLDPPLANATLLEARGIAFSLPSPEVKRALADALKRSFDSESGAITQLMLRGYAQLLTHGYPSGTDLLRKGMIALREKPELDASDLQLLQAAEGIAVALWDFDSWEPIVRRTIQTARDVGALSILGPALRSWSDVNVAAGAFAAAASALTDAETVFEVTGANFDSADATPPARSAAIPPAPQRSLHGKIAYSTRGGDIWVMNATGSGRRRITRSGRGIDFDPDFSPDGRHIVFRTSRGRYAPDTYGIGLEGIFVVDARTRRERQIQPRTGGLFPAWSPDAARSPSAASRAAAGYSTPSTS
jgi:WD40-like Beta Propeller Repeat